MINGLKIVESDAALEETDVRLFPESKHRSARIRKKLIKRFGGEFKKVPAIYRIGDTLVAHPTMYVRLQTEIAAKHRQHYDQSFMQALGRNPW